MELSPATRRRLTLGGALLLVPLLALAVRDCGRDRITGHAYDIPSGPDRLIVEVLNGTRRQGLARIATRQLRRRGIDVVFFGNAEIQVDTTRVVLRRVRSRSLGGARGDAGEVREALGAGRVVVDLDSLKRVDVTVILGPDFRPEEESRP